MLSTRDYAECVLNTLNDEQLIDFLRLFADDATLARFESDKIANGMQQKRYSSFSEILAEIDAEDDDE